MGIKNFLYFYKDTDINVIMEERLRQEELGSEITVLGAVSALQGGQLSDFVKENRSAIPDNRILLIPYNTGYAHWVGVLLEFDTNGQPLRAEYMDSLGFPPSAALKMEISSIDKRFKLQVNRCLRQYDLSSCGGFMIENLLRSAANGKPLKFQKTSSRAIRQCHADCLYDIKNSHSAISKDNTKDHRKKLGF